jgi:hypothetical protein
MEMTAVTANGHRYGERTRMPTLIPVIYALDKFLQVPNIDLARTNSVSILQPIDNIIYLYPWRIPNVKCPAININVINRGGTY